MEDNKVKLRYLILLCLVILCVIGGFLFFFSKNGSSGDDIDVVETKDSDVIEVNIINRGQDSIEELYIVKSVSDKDEENLLGDNVVLDENSACAVTIDGYDEESSWVSYAKVNGELVNADRELTSAELYDGATLDIIYDGENITYISVGDNSESGAEESSEEVETEEIEVTDEENETQNEEIESKTEDIEANQ